MERLPLASYCISTVYHEIGSFLCQGLLAVALEVSSWAPQICQLQLTSIYVGQQFQDKVILGLLQKFMPVLSLPSQFWSIFFPYRTETSAVLHCRYFLISFSLFGLVQAILRTIRMHSKYVYMHWFLSNLMVVNKASSCLLSLRKFQKYMVVNLTLW